jgi:hypothetical protein
MHVKYKQNNFALYDMIHQYVWDNGHGLTIYVNFYGQMCVIWVLDPMVVLWPTQP